MITVYKPAITLMTSERKLKLDTANITNRHLVQYILQSYKLYDSSPYYKDSIPNNEVFSVLSGNQSYCQNGSKISTIIEKEELITRLFRVAFNANIDYSRIGMFIKLPDNWQDNVMYMELLAVVTSMLETEKYTAYIDATTFTEFKENILLNLLLNDTGVFFSEMLPIVSLLYMYLSKDLRNSLIVPKYNTTSLYTISDMTRVPTGLLNLFLSKEPMVKNYIGVLKELVVFCIKYNKILHYKSSSISYRIGEIKKKIDYLKK